MTQSIARSAPLPAWLDRRLYPFAPRQFETMEGRLSYLDEGRGPVVLLVHGTPSWSFEFREVVRELARDHRVIVPDHLGFGLSDKPARAALTLARHRARLAALMEALDLREVTLVVHDFGGPIALPLALTPASRISRLLVLNSWMWPSDGDRTIARIDWLVRSPLGRFLYLRLGFPTRVILPAAFGDKRRLTPDIRAHYQGPLDSAPARAGTYAMALALKGGDAEYRALWAAREQLAALPMEIVWGARDPVLTEQHRRRWEATFPEAPLALLDDAGHFVAEERPDAVVAAVRRLTALA
jgi:haloalkane dehalogenase